MTARVFAPGKAMLFGEYAVLDGAPALVAAVSRYAEARLVDDSPPVTPFVAAAVARARADLLAAGREPPALLPSVDSRALYHGERKSGLGSSAAVTVAAYGSVLAGAGVALDDSAAIFRSCDEAHAAAQGVRGSGADVAASVFGGILEFRRGAPPLPVAWPAAVEMFLVDTGEAASTADLVGRYQRHAEESPIAHRGVADLFAALAEMFVTSLRDSPTDLFDLVHQWNDALDELGAQLDAELLTMSHRRIATAARAAGGAAKPSGAGAGDLAIVLAHRGTLESVRAAIASEGFHALKLDLGARGLYVERASS